MLKIFFVLALAVAARSQTVNLASFPGQTCFRNCTNSAPRVCYFEWNLEFYHVLGPACGTCGYTTGNVTQCYNEQCVTADGIQRGIMSVNRKLPGPVIHVCKDDLIVVDVKNRMGGTGATIHWHGFHQVKTPYFDGVPAITQCPIEFATIFRYNFYATEPGTHFYHGHAGHHRVNGIVGGIVVRQNPANDPNSNLYDLDLKEHLIVISDWMFHDAEWYMPGLRDDTQGLLPTNVLINGKGTVRNANQVSISFTPLEVFRVTRGNRYRFRIANTGSHVCPARLEIQNHTLQVIGSDSYDLNPVTVSAIYVNAGERFDFVVNANQPGDSFLLRVKLVGACESRLIQQFAVFSYKAPGALPFPTDLAFPTAPFPTYSESFSSSGTSVNDPTTICGDTSSLTHCISDLNSYVDSSNITDVEPDVRFCLGFKNVEATIPEIFTPNTYEHFKTIGGTSLHVGTINDISFQFPQFPLLSQPGSIVSSTFCDENTLPSSCIGKRFCNCLHRLKVALNAIVEIVIVDTSDAKTVVNHPFHLHGYKVFVTGMGQDSVDAPMTCARARARALRLPRGTSQKPLKDTISIPSKGFTVIRFKADNPGWWFLHCHYEWHMVTGMSLVIQVGETNQMVPVPATFPRCNNFRQTITTSMLNP